jgi:hypothetical protein
MPGFTSFLLSSTPLYTTLSSPTPCEADSESEHESPSARKPRLALGRQTTSVYGATLSRAKTERTLQTLKRLNSSLNAQAETYQYALLSSKLKRLAFVAEFVSRAQGIHRDDAIVLQQFQTEGVGGAVHALSDGFTELGQLTAAAANGDGAMDLGEMEKVVVVYRRRLQKPLGEMIRCMREVLRRKEGWRDAE